MQMNNLHISIPLLVTFPHTNGSLDPIKLLNLLGLSCQTAVVYHVEDLHAPLFDPTITTSVAEVSPSAKLDQPERQPTSSLPLPNQLHGVHGSTTDRRAAGMGPSRRCVAWVGGTSYLRELKLKSSLELRAGLSFLFLYIFVAV